ncbi:MAG: hypothetical protein OK474_01155 [Thaumarchaeota archaeon]|nr:hypothetical protein [Nitrososphaerota archaeon]
MTVTSTWAVLFGHAVDGLILSTTTRMSGTRPGGRMRRISSRASLGSAPLCAIALICPRMLWYSSMLRYTDPGEWLGTLPLYPLGVLLNKLDPSANKLLGHVKASLSQINLGPYNKDSIIAYGMFVAEKLS